MVSLSMVKSKGVPVNLPTASTGADQNRDEFTSITVTAENALLWNRHPIAPADLPAALQRLKSEKPDPRIFLNGDENSRLALTILVLDEARKCGITKVAFETKPNPATP
jgi:biopolymer transport protein ExbD